MVVKQSQLSATDTTTDMAGYYSDAVVTTIADVDRGIHNRTQFVRLVLQRSQPVTAFRADAGSPDVLSSKSDYIDGTFTPSPVSDTNIVIVGFAFGQLLETAEVILYSTQPVDTTGGNWNVATSSDNTDAQYILANFQATGISVVEVPLDDAATGGNGAQFKYTVSFTSPAIGGLQYWRIKHSTSEIFNDVTEVQIVEPLTPTISYFESSGGFASSFPFEQPNILDACWDPNNNPGGGGQFFTIRFNDVLTGTATVTLDDDFGEGDAGTASGTNNFNPARWTEDSNNTQFLRVGGLLSYNVASGKGQLETTYDFEDDFDVEIVAIPITVTTEPMWFTISALDVDNKALMSEGMGIETSPTTSGVFFSSYIDNFSSSAPDATVRDLRAQWHNTTSGTDSIAMVFAGGSTWTISGTQTGGLTDATTGVLYNQTTDAGTPIEFIISATATPTIGQQFTFDLITENAKKDVAVSGVIGITRTGSDWVTDNVITSPVSLGTAPVTIELFGNTDGLVNISADNYEVTTGSGSFDDVSVFSIERTDTEGDLLAITPTVIEAFDVIGDPSLTYNDFLDGRVQIACSSSGISTAGSIYIKINSTLYKYPNNISLSQEDGSNATISKTGQIAADGTSSLQWTRESGLISSDPTPFLTYLEFDETLDILHLRTINHVTLLDNTDAKELLLGISDYDTNRYVAFYNQEDFDTLYYVDSSTNLQAFNIDDRISAFMAINAEDVTLPAGTAQETDVNADVINAWGEALAGKIVTFSVAGDGAVTPASDTTDSSGRATTQFTVGSTVGISTVTATATES